MNWIKFLFVLFLLLQYSASLKAQEIQNYSDDLLLNQSKLPEQSVEDSKQGISFYLDQQENEPTSQLDGDYLLKTLKREIWDQDSSNWINDSLYEYSYNGKNLIDTSISNKWRNGNVWGNEMKLTFSYDSNDRLSFSNEFYWEGYWREYYRYYYDYYGNGNIYHINVHTSTGTEWLYVAMYTYSYNTNSDTTMIVLRVLDLYHGWWVYAWKDEFNYDSNNVLIKKTRFDHYYLPDWMPEINDLYFYNDAGNKTENIRQEWNNTDSTWVNDYRYLYEYGINNILLSTLYHDWQSDSSNWVNVWRETYNYTPQNKIATMIKETWTPEAGWQNYVLRTYYYDVNNNWTEKLTQLWDGSDWKNYYRHLATWLEPVSVEEEQITLNSYYLYNNFPNPFNPSTKIKFRIPVQDWNDNTKISLKVYDVLGNEIVTLVNEQKPAGEYEVEFEGNGLSSGIYFYTLKAGNFSETKKMILLK
ncbi:MAG: T9SS type A sorting domain-containing protein [Ignavibacteriaceae bacterium]|nr:T9SS type A sorting domain-containing protein [Ignavibacteriaceae bacterium]